MMSTQAVSGKHNLEKHPWIVLVEKKLFQRQQFED